MENNEIKAQKELYKAHLEFLGYSIEEDPNDEQEITATSGYKTCYFTIFEKEIRVLTILRTSEYAKNHRPKLLEFVNNLNNTRLARYMISQSDSSSLFVYISMFLTCPYERITFGHLLDLFSPQAGSLLAGAPDAVKFFDD